MNYTSNFFLLILSALVPLLYFLGRNGAKGNYIGKVILTLVSLFVIWSHGTFDLVLFLVVSVINYVFSIIIFNSTSEKKKQLLISAVVVDILILSYFKYAEFVASIFSADLSVSAKAYSFGIPLAISFYTFHIISYLVDLQKGRAKLLNPLDYILYLSFFPHVIAGPIIRVHQFSGQLQKKLTRNNDLRIGLYYFSIGFFLKTVGADNIGAGIDPFWTTEGVGGLDSAADYWSVAFLYYCQIYADFAGYSLMAIGMARLLGYKFPTNFRFPMIATSLQDFWRRWHITLSRWLRDYLYIPLGGSRNGITCTFSAIMITMLLGGLWHGAQWTFVVWGAVHGGGLVVERLLRIIPKNIRVNLTPLNWILTQLTVLIAWVFFRSPTVDFAYDFISSMFSIGSLADFNISSSIEILFAFALIPVLHNLLPKLPVHLSRKTRFKLHGIVTGLVLILGAVVHSAPNAFIYFRF